MNNEIIEKLNDELFAMGSDFMETMSSHNTLTQINKIYGINKSTCKNWFNYSALDAKYGYKKILITYFRYNNLNKTFEIQRKYNLDNNFANEKVLLKLTLMDNETLLKFNISEVDWKNTLIIFFLRINRFLLTYQFNIVRKKLNLPIINYSEIEDL